jgi:hypothetical protein
VAAGPPPGWYDDPGSPGSIRWWDGEAWTGHTQARPEAEVDVASAAEPEADPAPGPERPVPSDAEIAAMLRRPAEPEDPTLRRLMPVVLAGVAIVLALFLTAIYLSSRTEDEPGSGPVSVPAADDVAADNDAQRLVKTAQTAIETYATDHGGSYAGATSEALAQLEPGLAGAQLSVDAAADSYTVAVTSAPTSNTFTITRDSSGAVSLTCGEPNTGACPAGGLWR